MFSDRRGNGDENLELVRWASELAGAPVLGWGAQLAQSNLPGTCASSSTR